MKYSLILAAAAPLLGNLSLANAAEPNDAVRTAAINVFAGPLTIRGELKPPPPHEDLASPFVEAHSVEEYLYLNRYFTHYHVVPDNPNAAAPEEPTTPVDPEGRPLWFDGVVGGNILNGLVAKLAAHKQFDDLDRLFSDWSNSSERMADGRWKLTAFYNEINVWLSQVTDWDAAYQFVREWRDKKPDSAAAALLEVQYWYKYAWLARGHGWASSVAPEGWKLFRERMEKAQRVLTESKAYASGSPLWAGIQLKVGLGLDWPKDELFHVFQEEVAKEPYFYPLYAAMVESLLPKWGGSWKLVDDFIRAAVRNTESGEGYAIYARLYWDADPCNCEGPSLFEASQANWAEMKRGFEDLVRRYPHSAWLANKFAAYACMADDRDTYLRLRLQIGKTITADAWPQTYSLDLCEHKFPPQPL